MAEFEDTEELCITQYIWISTDSNGIRSFDISQSNMNLPGSGRNNGSNNHQSVEPEQECALVKPGPTDWGVIPTGPKAMMTSQSNHKHYMGTWPNQTDQNTHRVQYNGLPFPSAVLTPAPSVPFIDSRSPTHFPFHAAQPVFNTNSPQQPQQQGFQYQQRGPSVQQALIPPTVPPYSQHQHVQPGGRRSGNYKGNADLAANQSDNIPLEESCCLWITGLPRDCTYAMLLGSIRDCDKVWSLHLNPPLPKQGLGKTAAKLIFFSRRGVDRLQQQVNKGRFIVGLERPKVEMNDWLKKAAQPGPECRVIFIDGPIQIVDKKDLREFFSKKFTWEDEDVLADKERLQLIDGVLWPMRRIEWRFGSYGNQAQNAYKYLRRAVWSMGGRPEKQRNELYSYLWSHVRWWWGIDPCDVKK